jgi:hypothetical protein
MSNAIFPDRRRRVCASVQLAAGVAVFAPLALLVFGIWYPGPFQQISGGLHLYFLLAAVDLVIGPLLTLLVAAASKPLVDVRRDLAIIVVVQLCALAYGLHVLVDARPAWVAFERVQFRVLAAGEVEPSMLSAAPAELQDVPWSGPRLISAVLPSNPEEQFRAMQDGLAGLDLSYFPRNWRSYESQASRAWAAARPASELIARDPSQARRLQDFADAAGQPLEQLRYLPLRTKDGHWSILLAGSGAKVLGYLPVEGE